MRAAGRAAAATVAARVASILDAIVNVWSESESWCERRTAGLVMLFALPFGWFREQDELGPFLDGSLKGKVSGGLLVLDHRQSFSSGFNSRAATTKYCSSPYWRRVLAL